MLAYITEKYEFFKAQYHVGINAIIRVCLALLFLSFFDSIMSYVTPIVMIDSGLSEFQMGLIYSSSSLFGFLLDFVLVRYLKTTHYRITLFWTLVVALFFPVAMLTAPIVGLFLLGMFLWGLYYNLWGFATLDFTARESKVVFHVASATLLMTFHDLGFIAGTLLVEPLLSVLQYKQLLFVLELCIVFALFTLFPLTRKKTRNETAEENKEHTRNAESETLRLKRVVVKLSPLLVLGAIISMVEAVIWTVTPIIDTVFPQMESLGGIVLAVNFLPSFPAYALTTMLTSKFGKKKVGIASFTIGATILAILGFVPSVALYILISFLSAFCFAIAFAALGGTYADYLKESTTYDKEIVSSRDMAVNLGYIIGPLLGGYLITVVNSIKLFTYLGLFTLVIGSILFLITPKKIPFHDKDIEK